MKHPYKAILKTFVVFASTICITHTNNSFADPILNYSFVEAVHSSTSDNLGFGSGSIPAFGVNGSWSPSENLFLRGSFFHQDDTGYNAHGFSYSFGGYVPLSKSVHLLGSFGWIDERASTDAGDSDNVLPRDVFNKTDSFISPELRISLFDSTELNLGYTRFLDEGTINSTSQNSYKIGTVIRTSQDTALVLGWDIYHSNAQKFSAGIRASF